MTVGSGYIPFETEEQLERSIETHLRPKNVEKLFNEIQDDRYILETALAGRADILVTANVDDFRKGPAVRLQRNDVVLFPVADLTLVIATPWFTAYWLGQGIVPDSQFIAEHAEDFASYVTPSG